MMHDLLKPLAATQFVLVAAVSFGCGGDDNQGTDDKPVAVAGTSGGGAGVSASASAGKSGATGGPIAGSSGRLGSAGTAAATAGAGRSGAGAGGAAGHLGVEGEDDAGVPPSAGTGAGTAGLAGVGASGGAGGLGGSAGHAGSAAAGSGGGAAGAATFTQVYGILMANCSGNGCHLGTTRYGDMLSFADKTSAYTNLVGVASVSCQGEKRVVASDPDKSELVHALEQTRIGNCTNTPRMPERKPKLKQSDIDIVSSWVKAGALNN